VRRLVLIALVTSAIVTAGCSSQTSDMFSPPGLSRMYVRALLEGDDATLEEHGTVDAATRAAVAAEVGQALTADWKQVRTGGRLDGGDRVLMQSVVVDAVDGSSAIVYTGIDLNSRKVVNLSFRDAP